MSKKKMILGTKGVTYGLQVKGNQKETAKPSIFGRFAGEDDHSVDINAAVRAQQGVKRSDAKVKQMQAAALLEDANCFDYDSYYDDIQEKRKQEKINSFEKEKTGPRYLASMIAARDQRQKMRDIIYEKQEAVAAKADAEIYGEKEQFATTAYKKKLQEDKLFAEQMEARDKADEGKTVESQGMDGFLGILQSAVARQPEAELAGEEQEARAHETPESTGHESELNSLESMMEKKKRLKLEEKMTTMDKYERRRFELEHGLAAAPSRVQQGTSRTQSQAGGAAGADESQGVPMHSCERNKPQPGSTAPSQKPPIKRTAEEKIAAIAAARERAKQRRTKH